MANARETALKTLTSCRRGAAWSDAQLKDDITAAGLDARDAALATRLCYSVLQNRILLDYCIDHYSKIKTGHIEPKVLDLLRLGAVQLLFMDKIPASAAVNETVEMVKKVNTRSASFVNAVLRAIARGGMPEIKAKSSVEELSIKYSHPQPLTELLSKSVGEEQLEALLRADNSVPPVTVQVNTARTTSARLGLMLEEQGVTVKPHPWLRDCLELSSVGNVEKLRAYTEGLMTVQDAGARLCAMAAAPLPNTRVLDCCAAPGGKSFASAILMENIGSILACDIHEGKLRQISKNAQRLGIDIIKTSLMDGKVYNSELCEGFDVVIADVPCSGLGVIRKKPDVRYKDLDAISALPELQTSILKNVSRYVRPGGVLLYSTCTLNRAENEGVTDAFLSSQSEFEAEDFDLPMPIGHAAGGRVTLFPHIHGTDGFYICRMKRRK